MPTMQETKRIALVAHDNRKKDLAEWVDFNADTLRKHRLICTGTTGRLIAQVLADSNDGAEAAPDITRLSSGPLGGDQQLGALISEGGVDILVFFWDPMEPQPHDVDVKALLRIAVVYNIPIACNRSTADFVISSPLIEETYTRRMKDYTDYLERQL